MPRHPRLNALDTRHHVLGRGIERTQSFRSAADRADFVARLAALTEQEALMIYAWALPPNHAHLLVQTGGQALTGSMRGSSPARPGAVNRGGGP